MCYNNQKSFYQGMTRYVLWKRYRSISICCMMRVSAGRRGYRPIRSLLRHGRSINADMVVIFMEKALAALLTCLRGRRRKILFNTNDDSWTGITPLAVELARVAFLDGYYKAIAFGSGPCGICEECSVDHCRFPKKTVPSMEGCGIDVFATARNNGFTINTVKEKTDQHNYFGLVLFE